MYRDKVKQRAYMKEWRRANKDKIKIYTQRWEASVGIEEVRRWVKTYQTIRQRLKRSKDLDKWGNTYRCYVGILNFLTPTQLKFLWERDKAESMKQPSIDRIDSKGHYTIENCQYIEMSKNRSKVPVRVGWVGSDNNRNKFKIDGKYAKTKLKSD